MNRNLIVSALLGLSLTLGAGAQNARPTAVAVKLTEWSMGMMTMTIKGPTEFDVVNVGKYPHVFTIQGTVGDQPFMISSALLKAGEKTTLTVSLPAGTYEVYCPIPGHADKGMKGTLTVQ